MLRPVSAEAVSTFGRRRSLRSTRARSRSRSNSSPRGQVPLVEHERGRAARLHRQLGDPQVLRVTPSVASQTTSATSARSAARCERSDV